MRDPGDMSCDAFAGVAAELALGVLTGRERAAALEHLDRCDGCRESIRQLSLTGEELLGLLPAIEPPPGFETRVLDRLGLAVPEPARRVRGGRRNRVARAGPAGSSRRTLAAAAVALAVVGAALGGWGLRAATTPAAGSELTSAALLTASHQAVGKLFLYNGSPRWVYMSVYIESAAAGPVTCELVGRDGRVTRVGTFRMDDGYGAWGSPDPVDNGPLSGARLVSATGRVLATASFSRSLG